MNPSVTAAGNQRGDGQNRKVSAALVGPTREGEGNLPHHQRDQDGQNHQSRSEKMPFAHRYINYRLLKTFRP